MQDNLIKYIEDQDNPILNFNLAEDYDRLNQHASAVTFYLRSAERSQDNILRSEALFKAGICFCKQNRRNFTAEGLFQYAIQENKSNINAYIELSKLYAKQQKWRESSLYASLCPDPTNIYALYQKYLAMWHIGVCNEASVGMLNLKYKNKIDDQDLLNDVNMFIDSKVDKDLLLEYVPDFIDYEYEKAKSVKSDINEHLEVLHELAKECDTITEVGVRSGVSTRAFLKARKKLSCYDIEANSEVLKLVEKAKATGIDVTFTQADILNIELKETDLLFIDTLHTYKQLKSELKLHSEKAKKYIAFHDTVTFGLKNEVNDGSEKQGLIPAIMEFMSENKNWKVKKFYTNNNGLTVLERITV